MCSSDLWRVECGWWESRDLGMYLCTDQVPDHLTGRLVLVPLSNQLCISVQNTVSDPESSDSASALTTSDCSARGPYCFCPIPSRACSRHFLAPAIVPSLGIRVAARRDALGKPGGGDPTRANSAAALHASLVVSPASACGDSMQTAPATCPSFSVICIRIDFIVFNK